MSIFNKVKDKINSEIKAEIEKEAIEKYKNSEDYENDIISFLGENFKVEAKDFKKELDEQLEVDNKKEKIQEKINPDGLLKKKKLKGEK